MVQYLETYVRVEILPN